MIDEGMRPLDGQFRKLVSYCTNDGSVSQEPPSPNVRRVMTDHELLLSLHHKFDRNHKWVKRQFGAIVKDLNATRNAVKKNHYYLHQIFDRTWAILSHLKTSEELTEMEFQQDLTGRGLQRSSRRLLFLD